MSCGMGATGPSHFKSSPFSMRRALGLIIMNLLSAHCRVCKGDQFRALPPESWVERVILPRLFLCQGKCIVCHKQRYLPTFQRWTTVPNSWR